MKRKVIRIDEEKCNGCGLCIPNCPEGALQIINGKARMTHDFLCDGLGACLGHCPEGAIAIEEREAEAYDEIKVMDNVVRQGQEVLEAHVRHLKEHGETVYLQQALEYLRESHSPPSQPRPSGGCPGSQAVSFGVQPEIPRDTGPSRPSRLTHWPIQLHLISPLAPHFHGADLLLAADCVAYSLGDFHKDYLDGKILAIACPKLDDGQEIYLEKLVALIDTAQIKSMTVLIMQVPCCSGLLNLARSAAERSSRKTPIQYAIVGIQGRILQQGCIDDHGMNTARAEAGRARTVPDSSKAF